MDADQDKATDENKVRWPLVILAVVIGIAVLVGAWLVAYDRTLFKDEHAAFWSGLLVNIGTTVLLATVLVWFERTIVRRVKRQTAVAVARAVSKVASDAADQATAAVSSRMAALEEAFRERSGRGATSRVAAAELVGEHPTFEATFAALSAARRIQAIGEPRYARPRPGGGEIVVPAGNTLAAPMIVFSVLDNDDLIFVGQSDGRARSAGVIWDEGDDPLDILTQLHEKMLAEGHGEALKDFSVETLFSNLSRALQDATIAREHQDERWLSGKPVREMITPDCFLTDAGIELRNHGLVAERSKFGRIRNQSLMDFDVPEVPPEHVSLDVWQRAVERGRSQYTNRSVGVQLPSYSSYWD